jgi:hypothetical protein
LLLTPPAVVQRHLAAAAADRRREPDLYGALLTGKVYAKDLDVILGVDGPCVEFAPRPTACGPALALFTSRDRLGSTSRSDGLPFQFLLDLLPDGVGLLIDPDHEAFVVCPADVAMLKRISR